MWLRLADAAVMLGNVGAAPARGNQNLPQSAPPFDLVYIQIRSSKRSAILGVAMPGRLVPYMRHGGKELCLLNN